MTNSIFQEIKKSFQQGGNLVKLIYANLGVFLVINLFLLFLFLFKQSNETSLFIINKLSVPASFKQLIYQPWSILSYMFIHKDLFHVLGNMLLLYLGGRIFEEYFGTEKIIATYLIGGICGALLYMLAFNIFPVFNHVIDFSFALGASASVLAVLVAAAVLVPELVINLMLFGPVKLKYIALILIIFDLLSISKDNPGGHIAHLGGAIWGYVYASQYKKGTDLTRGISSFFKKLKDILLFKKRSSLKVAYKRGVDDFEYNAQKKSKQQRMDEILDKISKSGYESLSKEEKEILFKISKDQY